MKTLLILFKHYLNFIAFFSPKLAGKRAMQIFQKVRIKKIKPAEQEFYKRAIFKTLAYENKTIHYYELGEQNNPILFLAHGWNSNAGSLSAFAFKFTQLGYRVIDIDFPGHGKASGTHTNMFECKNIFQHLIKHINPQEEFSVIGHSFGSSVSSFALAEGKFKVNKLVLLTTINELVEVFKDFKKLVNFNDKVFRALIIESNKLLNIDIERIKIAEKIKQVAYNDLLVIHDEFDKVIPFQKSLDVVNETENSAILKFQKIGHYRMLWNDDLLEKTVDFIYN